MPWVGKNAKSINLVKLENKAIRDFIWTPHSPLLYFLLQILGSVALFLEMRIPGKEDAFDPLE